MRAAARAELELELAKAKEARIQTEIQALDAASSRDSSDIDSLADRAGLGPAAAHRHAAPPTGAGAAHSPKPERAMG